MTEPSSHYTWAMSDGVLAARRATAADAAALAELAVATFTETFGHLYPPEDLADYLARTYSATACREMVWDSRMAYWLVGEAPPVGYALAGYCKLPVDGLEPTAGELRQLYVRSTHQNRRLGTRLFEAALAWLEQRYAPLYIGVWSKNDGAQRFYERYGFVKVGEYDFPGGRRSTASSFSSADAQRSAVARRAATRRTSRRGRGAPRARAWRASSARCACCSSSRAAVGP